MLLKFATLEHGKTPMMGIGELANQTFQWKIINGAMYVTLPMEFYTDL